MMQQASKRTVPFMIRMEKEQTRHGVDTTTTYHAFMSKFDIDMRALLDNVQVHKRANGGGSLTWADMVAICRD